LWCLRDHLDRFLATANVRCSWLPEDGAVLRPLLVLHDEVIALEQLDVLRELAAKN
jgi:hypothetical protein